MRQLFKTRIYHLSLMDIALFVAFSMTLSSMFFTNVNDRLKDTEERIKTMEKNIDLILNVLSRDQ